MARFIIPSGKEPDTCETDCSHRDCAGTRRMLAKSCRHCGLQFHGGDAVVRDNKNSDGMVHWECELAALPSADEATRDLLDRAIDER